MNTVTMTRAEFDALPAPPTAAPKPKKGVRWKHFYHGHWFVAEYVEVAQDVLGIEFREVIIEVTEAGE